MTKRLALHWKILIGLLLGVGVGVLLNRLGGSIQDATADSPWLGHVVEFLVDLTRFTGNLFVRALRFVAVPIVLFSLVEGAASLGDLRKLGRIGTKTVLIYLATTAVAVIIGLAMANWIRPGSYIGDDARDRLAGSRTAEIEAAIGRTGEVPDLWQQLLDMVPANPFAALAHDTALHVRSADGRLPLLGQGSMLQVIVLALAIGIGLTLLKRERAQPVIDLCGALTEVMVKLVHIIMWLAPYAVFALIVPVVTSLGLDVIRSLAVYAGTVLLCLLLILLLEYPLWLRLFAGIGFRRFFRAMAPAQLLAFSSSSSSATLPVTMECARERLGVSEEVTSFVCPLGATINMDGTALYQAVATIFISELYGFDLSLWQQLTVLLTAVLASIGTPGIPGAGVLMLIIVLESVGIPPASIAGGIAVILGIDRILDMCRTVINVSGDGMTAAIVAKGEGALRGEAEVAEALRRQRAAGLDESP